MPKKKREIEKEENKGRKWERAKVGKTEKDKDREI